MVKQRLQRLVLLAILGAGLVLLLSQEPNLTTAHAEGLPVSDRVSLTGRLTDPQGEPIRGAAVEPHRRDWHLSMAGLPILSVVRWADLAVGHHFDADHVGRFGSAG